MNHSLKPWNTFGIRGMLTKLYVPKMPSNCWLHGKRKKQ
jgi:hypothetical protein